MFERYKKYSVMILCFLATLYIFYLLINPLTTVFNFLYDIILPFFLAFGVAFIFHPLVDWLENHKIKRIYAVFLVFSGIVALFALMVASILPIFIKELNALSENSAQIYTDINNLFKSLSENFSFLPEDKRPSLNNIFNLFNENSDVIGEILINFAIKAYEKITMFLFVPIIALYLLYDFRKIEENISAYLLKRKRTLWHAYLKEMKSLLKNYFRGVFLVMFLLIFFATIGFYFIGLDYPLLFGIIIGISNLIPIIGQLIGGAIVILYALTQSIGMAIGVLIIVLILQLVESNFLTPYIQSKSAKISPIFIILAFLVFGRLFGLLGMILAVPLVGVIYLTVRYIREYNLIKKKLKTDSPE